MPISARDDVGTVPYKFDLKRYDVRNFLLRRFSIYATMNYV